MLKVKHKEGEAYISEDHIIAVNKKKNVWKKRNGKDEINYGISVYLQGQYDGIYMDFKDAKAMDDAYQIVKKAMKKREW